MKIFRNGCLTVFGILILCGILYIVLSILIVKGMQDSARLAEKESRSIVVEQIDSFVSLNGKLPATLSELGFRQTAAAYDFSFADVNKGFGGIYEFQAIPDRNDTAYILMFRYESGDHESFYLSRLGEWYDELKDPKFFKINDTLTTIKEIRWNLKYGINRDKVSVERHLVPNHDIGLSYMDFRYDSLIYLRYRQEDSRMSMEGWALTDGGTFFHTSYDEYGDWRYCDEDGNVYHKFWNYMKNDTLVFKPDPLPKRIYDSPASKRK